MYKLVVAALFVAAASAALLSTPDLEKQVLKYDMLVDVMQARVQKECPEESWRTYHGKLVKRAVRIITSRTDLSFSAVGSTIGCWSFHISYNI